MRRALLLQLALLTLLGCRPAVPPPPRELTVEAGIPTRFAEPGVDRWSFGDDASTSAAPATHVFWRTGTFLARGTLKEQPGPSVRVVVEPRQALHAVPPVAQNVAVARTLEDLANTIDFAERLVGSASVQQVLDDWPAIAFALEAPANVVDPAEGAAVFSLPGRHSLVSAIGVQAPDALERFSAWLAERGWKPVGDGRFLRGDELLVVLVDRGWLYACFEADPAVLAVLRATPAAGLTALPELATSLDGLSSGGLVLLSQASAQASWHHAVAAVSVQRDGLILRGEVVAPGPLWAAGGTAPLALLGHAPEGPVVTVGSALAASNLLQLAGPGLKARLTDWLLHQGLTLPEVLAAVPGPFQAGVWLDVPGFVTHTLANGGRPEVRGAVLLEAPVTDPAVVGHLVESVVISKRWPLAPAHEGGVRLWKGPLDGDLPLEVALTPNTLLLKLGEGLAGRNAVDLTKEPSLEGLFGPGHVSLVLDVGQVGRELREPRQVPGVDPRRSLTATALAVTFVERFTGLDQLVFDAVPAPHGAKLEVRATLRPPGAGAER